MPKNTKKPAPKTASLPTTLTITIPDTTTEQDFIKKAQREARRAARRLWREQHPVILSRGGRPSLKRAVWAALDEIWKDWGCTFPRRRSSAKALVDAVAKCIPGARTDLRTIEAHVREWIDCKCTMRKVPESWLRTAQGKDLVRSQYIQSILGELIRDHGLTFTATCPPSAIQLLNERMKSLASVSDKELLRSFISYRQQ